MQREQNGCEYFNSYQNIRSRFFFEIFRANFFYIFVWCDNNFYEMAEKNGKIIKNALREG